MILRQVSGAEGAVGWRNWSANSQCPKCRPTTCVPWAARFDFDCGLSKSLKELLTVDHGAPCGPARPSRLRRDAVTQHQTPWHATASMQSV
jgi:hypothetical protein